ncbi:hypothetical protein ACJX0J_041500 [Zea mays]
MWREGERVVAHGRPKRSQSAWLAAEIRRAPTREAKEHAAAACSLLRRSAVELAAGILWAPWTVSWAVLASRQGWSSDGGKCCHGRGVWLSSMAVQISGAAGIVLGAETWRGAKGGRGKIAGRHGRKRWASCCSPWTTAARCGCCFMGKTGGEGPGRHGSYCCPWKINRTQEQQGKGGRPSTPAAAMGKLESAMPLHADVAEQERDVELQVSHGRKTAGSLELLLGADGCGTATCTWGGGGRGWGSRPWRAGGEGAGLGAMERSTAPCCCCRGMPAARWRRRQGGCCGGWKKNEGWECKNAST